eukprot:m51a1_g10813 hypothetical protein (251) ;mRNA; f:37672-38576
MDVAVTSGDAFDVDVINLAVLRREDPAVTEIIERADHVALYSWDNGWAKMEVQGCLFVAAREGVPRHRFVVVNQCSPANLWVDVCPSDLQLHPPHLVFRTAACGVIGIWFLTDEQRDRVAAVLQRVLAEASSGSENPTSPRHSDDVEDIEADALREELLSLPDIMGTSAGLQSDALEEPLPLGPEPGELGELSAAPVPAQISSDDVCEESLAAPATREEVRAALLRLATSDVFLDAIVAELSRVRLASRR